MTPVRIGLAGAGPWAAAHAGHLAAHPDVDFVGVWARRPDAAAEFARAAGCRAFPTYADLLAACDAIDICVPPAAQPELAVTAAGQGKHLMLEKPVALDTAGARAVADACAEAGVVSQLMLSRRFHPLTQRFLARVRSDFPRVDGVSAHYVHGAFLGGAFATPWRLTEGVLMDLGPHLFDLMEQTAGPVLQIAAARNEHDALAVTTWHEGGALGSAILSGSSAGPGAQRLLVFGREGKLTFDAAEVDENTLFRGALDDFTLACTAGSPVLADARRGVELQQILDSCRASLRSGTPVRVGDPD